MNINDKIKFSAHSYTRQNKVNDKANDKNNRELQMIPTYLELAQIDNQDRFNKNDIEEITKAFKKYDTKLSITNTLKELLAIGETKEAKLTKTEIINFLEATSGLKQLEQKNIIEFVKIAKENEQDKVTIETIKENMPYAKFKDRMLHNKFDQEFAQRDKNWLSEENIQKRYEIMVENEYRITSNKFLQKALNIYNVKPIKYINKENRIFVEELSKCNNQKGAYNVIKTLGVTPSVTASIQALSDIYKLADENKGVIIDLNRGFYPSEIKQINDYFKANKNNKILMDKLKYHIYNIQIDNHDGTIVHQNLQRERKRFLKEFGLEDKILLKPLVTVYKEDVYPTSPLGRGTRISQGNFEAGKKRR